MAFVVMQRKEKQQKVRKNMTGDLGLLEELHGLYPARPGMTRGTRAKTLPRLQAVMAEFDLTRADVVDVVKVYQQHPNVLGGFVQLTETFWGENGNWLDCWMVVQKQRSAMAQANGAGPSGGLNGVSSTVAAPVVGGGASNKEIESQNEEDRPTLPKLKAWIRGDVARMLREPPPPTRWLVEGLIPAAVPGILAARSGVGKSSTALLAAAGLAAGLPVLGRQVGHDASRGVVFAGLEDDAPLFNGRLSRAVELLSEDHQWTDQHRLNLERNLVPLFPEWASGAAYHLEAQWRDLAKMAMAMPDGCGLVVLDTLASMTDGDENKASDMRSFNAAAAALAQTTGAAVLSIHHVGKGNDTPSDKKLWQRLHPEALRGSSAVEAAARFVLQMAALSPAEAVTAGLDAKAVLRGDYVALHLSKISSAEKGDTVLLERRRAGERGGGFLCPHPQSERILAVIQGAGAVLKLTRRDSVLLAIAEAGGLKNLDQAQAAARIWPDSTSPSVQWRKMLTELRKAGWLTDPNLTDAGWAQAAVLGFQRSGGTAQP